MPLEASPTAQVENTPAPSLRDTLTAAVDAVESGATIPDTAPAAPAAKEAAPAVAEPKPAPVVDDAGRVRGADGKFAAKPAEAAPVVEQDEYRPPKGWKNDYRPHWEKLARGQPLTKEEAQAVGKYWEDREGEFAKGVSTYKQEWDRARPILEALHPYRDLIAGANTTPDKFVAAIGSTHQILTSGSPQDKLREIARFATAYGVPLHELFVQGEDGKLYTNQQYFQPQQNQQPQALTADEVDKRVEQRLARERVATMVSQFKEAKDTGGNPLYPHHEAVWKTMDGILRAGLAQDLPSAYKAALALPQHSDLIQSAPLQANAQDDTEKKRLAAAAALKAKAQTVSPRSQAQTSMTTVAPKRDGLRASLESAFETHLGNGGRV